MEKFSHAPIFWWISENDTKEARSRLQANPPFEKAPQTGVFACRSPYRPNSIGFTVVKLIEIDLNTGLLVVDHMDAFEKSLILDYIPNSEHIPLDLITIPYWFEELKHPRL